MKTLIISLAMSLAVTVAFSQSPAPDPDTLQNPVKQIDPEVKQLPPDVHYADESVRINAEELPEAVLNTLKTLEPGGWEKSVVYHYTKKNYYIIEIRAHDRKKTLYFDKSGKQLNEPVKASRQ